MYKSDKRDISIVCSDYENGEVFGDKYFQCLLNNNAKVKPECVDEVVRYFRACVRKAIDSGISVNLSVSILKSEPPLDLFANVH